MGGLFGNDVVPFVQMKPKHEDVVLVSPESVPSVALHGVGLLGKALAEVGAEFLTAFNAAELDTIGSMLNVNCTENPAVCYFVAIDVASCYNASGTVSPLTPFYPRLVSLATLLFSEARGRFMVQIPSALKESCVPRTFITVALSRNHRSRRNWYGGRAAAGYDSTYRGPVRPREAAAQRCYEKTIDKKVNFQRPKW